MLNFKDYVLSESSTYCSWCRKHMKGKEVGYDAPEVSHGMCYSCAIQVWGDMLKDERPGTPGYIEIQNKIAELRARLA